MIASEKGVRVTALSVGSRFAIVKEPTLARICLILSHGGIKRKMRKRLYEFWNRYEQMSAYVLVAVVVAVEILSVISPVIDSDFPESGRIALLAAGLLLFFRSIDRSIASIRTPILRTEFTPGFGEMLKIMTKPRDLKIIANDGLRYYSVISESDTQIRSVQLILADQTHYSRWKRLAERNVVGSLDIRLNHDRPLFHLCVANDEMCLIGTLTPRTGGLTTSKNVLIEARSEGSKELVESFSKTFDNMWSYLGSSEVGGG
jgi:hypothetical protein